MIPKRTIEQIIETARVEEVVGDFVRLKKKGTNLWGLCPFHNEKTPSFSVSPSKNIYKCFGCGKGGKAVNFIMDHEKMSYPEALKFLARKYSIEIEEKELTPEQLAKETERESLLLCLTYAQRTFNDNLMNTEEGRAIGLSYFKERGFSKELTDTFQLGYCFDRADAFATRALKEQYGKQALIGSGLCLERDSRLLDRFKGRVMFPVHSLSGRVIAFGGRTLRTDKKTAKYINSPETEVYHKSHIVYGIFQARKEIIKKDLCYLVEGYTDVLSLHQAGITNVVASSGTSLTVDQIRLIKRQTNNLCIMYDGDDAGIKASFRGIDLVLQEGMNVRTVLFPEGEDPDSYAKKLDAAELRDFISTNAKDFIQFKTELLVHETSGDPVKTAGLIKEIISSIALIPDPIVRNLYVRECSSIMHMPEEMLMNELNRKRRLNRRGMPRRETLENYESDADAATLRTRTGQSGRKRRNAEFQERDVIKKLIQSGHDYIRFEIWNEEDTEVVDHEKVNVASYIVTEIEEDGITFDNPLYQRIFDEFVAMLEKDSIPTEQHFLDHSDPDISSLTVNFVTSKYALSTKWQKPESTIDEHEKELRLSVINVLNILKLRKMEAMINTTREEMSKAKDDDLIPLMEKLQRQLTIRKKIAKALGSIILR